MHKIKYNLIVSPFKVYCVCYICLFQLTACA